MAEWSKALVLGTSLSRRGFESHRCQIILVKKKIPNDFSFKFTVYTVYLFNHLWMVEQENFEGFETVDESLGVVQTIDTQDDFAIAVAHQTRSVCGHPLEPVKRLEIRLKISVEK